MRKKTGNSVVNKTITVAMSGMMIMSTPAMQVYAAESSLEKGTNLEDGIENSSDSPSESNVEEQVSDVSYAEDSQSTDSKYDVSSVELEADSDKVEANMKAEADKYVSKEFFEEVKDKFDDTDMNQDIQAIMDESVVTAEGIAADITDSFVENVDSSSTVISETPSNIKESDAYTSLEQTKDTLENSTNTLLNDDKEIAASVEENTVVDTITSEGDIQISISSEDGINSTQDLNDYVTTQKEIITNASNEAENIVNSLSATPTADEISNAKADISGLIDEAQSAYDDAQAAVDSAEAVLNKEITDYNSYAQMCGLPQLDGSSSDESQDILQQQIDSLTSQLEESDAKVIEALTKIQTAKELLDNSQKVTKQAHLIINCLRDTEEALDDTADEWLKSNKDIFDTKSDTFDYCNAAEIVLTNSKDALEKNIEIIEKRESNGELSEYEKKLKESLVSALEQCQECIDDLSKDNEDDYFKAFNAYYSAIDSIYTEYNRDLEDGQELYSYHLRFLAAIDSGNKLTANISKDIEAKQKKVEAAQEAYASALAEYKQLRIEYANTANALQYFKPLKEKLDNAAKNLADAKSDLNIAKLTLKDIKDITISDSENNSYVDPVNPENPTVDPIEPVNPENPTVDPISPVNPENPTVDPISPVNPENPTEPINSENTVSDSNSTVSSSSAPNESASAALPAGESNYIIESTTTLAPNVESETPVSTFVDENVALADTIPDSTSDAPVTDSTTIADGETALADSIPQTGDRTHSALPVALAGAAAIAGAIYLGFRKRI